MPISMCFSFVGLNVCYLNIRRWHVVLDEFILKIAIKQMFVWAY